MSDTASVEQRYLSTAEAAVYLGVTVSSLKGLVYRHGLPVIRPHSRMLRFDRQDLDLWMRQRRQEAETV